MVPHPSEHQPLHGPISRAEAEELAESIRAFGSASRLMLLSALAAGERTVEQLSAVTAIEQSAVSHQLRLLRGLRLVAVRRVGRHAHYRLHDHHVPELLAALRHHHEHVHPPAPPDLPADARATRAG